MTKHNQLVIKGIIIGTIVPIVSAILLNLFLTFFPRFSFLKVLDLSDVFKSGDLVSTFIQFGIMVNLLTFFYFLQRNNQPVQKGIVIPTILYTALAVYFKLF